jgi:hypothetical protein
MINLGSGSASCQRGDSETSTTADNLARSLLHRTHRTVLFSSLASSLTGGVGRGAEHIGRHIEARTAGSGYLQKWHPEVYIGDSSAKLEEICFGEYFDANPERRLVSD